MPGIKRGRPAHHLRRVQALRRDVDTVAKVHRDPDALNTDRAPRRPGPGPRTLPPPSKPEPQGRKDYQKNPNNKPQGSRLEPQGRKAMRLRTKPQGIQNHGPRIMGHDPTKHQILGFRQNNRR